MILCIEDLNIFAQYIHFNSKRKKGTNHQVDKRNKAKSKKAFPALMDQRIEERE